MTFVLLSYAKEPVFWEDGDQVGAVLEGLKNDDPDEFTRYMRSQGNKRWYDCWLSNDRSWPHPNRIMVDITRLDPYTQVDWMPEINQLGLYVESEGLMEYLKEYCGSVMYYHEAD